MVMLQNIDARWKDHLQVIDHLKEGINLRAYAQKDPLVEYKKEGFRAFEQMNHMIASEVVEKLLKIQLVSQENTEEAMREQQERRRQQQLKYQGSEASAEVSALQRPMQMPGAQRQGQMQEAPPPGFPSRQALRDDGPKMNRAQRRKLEKKKNSRF